MAGAFKCLAIGAAAAVAMALLYLLLATLLDMILVGRLGIDFTGRRRGNGISCRLSGGGEIPRQSGPSCSGYASAYVLRRLGVPVQGDKIYAEMPGKWPSGLVSPRSILKLFARYGFKARYRRGGIGSLAARLSQGVPVIVFIRARPRDNGLHFVPVVGVDSEWVYLADSLAELANCPDGRGFNRRLRHEEFLKLWNTRMLRMPLYKNTYIYVEAPHSK